MEIRMMKIEDLKPADYNPRIDLKPGDAEYEKLKRSIESFGFAEPVVFNEKTGNIVGGHQRLKVLEDLEYEEIPVSVVSLDDGNEKALNLALNKIKGEWDHEKLKDVLLEIDHGGVDVELTGFDYEEIEKMMTQVHQELNDGEEIDLDDFEDDHFNCRCPECDFHFNVKG